MQADKTLDMHTGNIYNAQYRRSVFAYHATEEQYPSSFQRRIVSYSVRGNAV